MPKSRKFNVPTEIIGVVPEFVRHPNKSDAWMLSPFDVRQGNFTGALINAVFGRG